jgi:hypothetical protein
VADPAVVHADTHAAGCRIVDVDVADDQLRVACLVERRAHGSLLTTVTTGSD